MPLIKKTPLPAAPSGGPGWRAHATLLQSGTADERFSAARALAGEADAMPALEAALVTAGDSRLKEAIFTSLARQNSVAGYEVVIRHLRSDDAGLRSLALDALRLMPDQTVAGLPTLLQDNDSDIRVLACELARQILPAEGAALLAGLLETEQEVNVCAAAIEVLAEIGSASELPGLAACAARFPAEVFLNFSTRTASERILARTKS